MSELVKLIINPNDKNYFKLYNWDIMEDSSSVGMEYKDKAVYVSFGDKIEIKVFDINQENGELEETFKEEF